MSEGDDGPSLSTATTTTTTTTTTINNNAEISGRNIVSSNISRELASNVNDFWSCGGTIDVMDAPITDHDVLVFVRDYVSTRRPCILRNAFSNYNNNNNYDDDDNNKSECRDVPTKLTVDDILARSTNTNNDHHPIPKKQSSSSLEGENNNSLLSSSSFVTVDVTPDGHGDCIRRVIVKHSKEEEEEEVKMFVKPMEVSMTLQQFVDEMRNGRREKRKKKKNERNMDVKETNSFFLLEPTNHKNNNSYGNNDDDDDVKEYFPNQHNNNIRNIKTQPYPLSTMNLSSSSFVYYYSRQNDCLRTELAPLLPNIHYPPTFRWAEMAFGTGPPDAINLWIGDERAVSSMHKDPYENLFYVWSGQKVFTVLPPSDVLFLPEDEYSCGSFIVPNNNDDNAEWYVQPEYQDIDENDNDQNTNGASSLVPNEKEKKKEKKKIPEKVRWIEPDVEDLIPPSSSSSSFLYRNSDAYLFQKKRSMMMKEQYPSLEYVNPIRVIVKEGDMLYLPSLWFHRVTQTCETVGINYWYDMKFEGPHWSMFQLLQQMKHNQHS